MTESEKPRITTATEALPSFDERDVEGNVLTFD